MSNDSTSTVELETEDLDCEITEEPPLKSILNCLINNSTKQSTVLTNGQLMDVLKIQYNRDVYKMHSVELEMYINIMKKFLKDWHKWSEFEARMSPLRKVNDNKKIIKLVNEQYEALEKHLRKIIDLATPLVNNAVKKIKMEKSCRSVELDEIVMEVVCTRDQLNKLVYRIPQSDLSTAVFNSENCSPSRINLLTWLIPSILHMWNVKIHITLNSLVYRREMTHSLKHVLINQQHTSSYLISELSTDFQVKSSRSKEVMKNELIKIFKEVLLMYDGTDKLQLLNEIFAILFSDLKDAPNVLNVPARYRRYMSKYPYVRYLYTENNEQNPAEVNTKYDLQLQEMVSPMFQIFIGKLDTAPLELPSFEDWLVIECGYCKVKFFGQDLGENLAHHFNVNHQNELDWTCSKCQQKFSMKTLTELKWTHNCQN